MKKPTKKKIKKNKKMINKIVKRSSGNVKQEIKKK